MAVPSIPGIEDAVKTLVLTLDLVGTFAFALSGAAAGVRRRLDIFGVFVVSFAAACSGGILRDMLIGSTPPAALSDLRYLGVSLIAGLAVFFREADLVRYRHVVQLFDSAGLALFAVAGAQKALAFGMHPVFAALLGMTTAIGGGIVVDVLLANVPAVLRKDIYALAALLGAAIVVLGSVAGMPYEPMSIAGATSAFALRQLSIRHGWRLPTAKPSRKEDNPQ